MGVCLESPDPSAPSIWRTPALLAVDDPLVVLQIALHREIDRGDDVGRIADPEKHGVVGGHVLAANADVVALAGHLLLRAQQHFQPHQDVHHVVLQVSARCE